MEERVIADVIKRGINALASDADVHAEKLLNRIRSEVDFSETSDMAEISEEELELLAAAGDPALLSLIKRDIDTNSL